MTPKPPPSGWQAQMTTAEVMTTAFVAAEMFGGCFEKARWMLMEQGYIKRMLSKSRFNRRLHQIPETVWLQMGHALGEAHKALNPDQEYIVDSMPVPICDNIRISRSHLYRGEDFRGKIARDPRLPGRAALLGPAALLGAGLGKHRYFYGLRIHLVVTATGMPACCPGHPAAGVRSPGVEFELAPGSVSDIRAFKSFDLDLPAGATVSADIPRSGDKQLTPITFGRICWPKFKM